MTMEQIKALAQGVAYMMYDYNCAKEDAHKAYPKGKQDKPLEVASSLEDAIGDVCNAYRKAGLTVRRMQYHNNFGSAFTGVSLTDIETGRMVVYEADQASGLSEDCFVKWQAINRQHRKAADEALKDGKITELEYVEA